MIVSLFLVQFAWDASLKLLQASLFHKIYIFKKITKSFTKKCYLLHLDVSHLAPNALHKCC